MAIWFEQRVVPTGLLTVIAGLLVLALLLNACAMVYLAYSNLRLVAVKENYRYTRHSASKRD